MGTPRCAVLFVLTLGAVQASRVNRAQTSQHVNASDESTAEGQLCDLKERETSLQYGIHGQFPVKGCAVECKFNHFFMQTFPNKIMIPPDQEEQTCKCNYAPRYWEGAGSKKFWFQFRISNFRKCTATDCRAVFLDWGNGFLKRENYNGWNEQMPVDKRLESQENYDLTCTSGIPEGIVLPSPASKILELRRRIAKTDDPEEKARLQAILDELMGGKEVEVFEYDLDGDWGEEHHAESSSQGGLHSFFLKPCKSNMGNVETELSKIIELCGPWEKDISMKEGELRYSYNIDMDWGPERVCGDIDAAKCQMLQEEVDKDGFKLLSFRLKPCMTPAGEQELEDLDGILAEEHCGKPSLGESLLPVKVSAAAKFDSSAPEDELEFPCP